MKPVETEIAQEKVLEAARRVSGRDKTEKESSKNVQVTFANKDLRNFNTQSKNLIRDQTGQSEQDKVL